MARVKTELVSLPHDRGRFKLTTNFSPKTGKFSCAYPQDVADALGVEASSGDTMEEAREAWEKGCKEAGDANKVVERIIVIKARLNGTIYRHGKQVFGEADSSSGYWAGSPSVSLEVGVFDEALLSFGGERKVYRYTYVESSLPKSASPPLGHQTSLIGFSVERNWRKGTATEKHDRLSRIPWSPEAEAWALGLVTALENVILKLETLRNDQKALRDSIDRGRNLLTG